MISYDMRFEICWVWVFTFLRFYFNFTVYFYSTGPGSDELVGSECRSREDSKDEHFN